MVFNVQKLSYIFEIGEHAHVYEGAGEGEDPEREAEALAVPTFNLILFLSLNFVIANLVIE